MTQHRQGLGIQRTDVGILIHEFNKYTGGSDRETQESRKAFFAALERIERKLERAAERELP